MYERVRTCDGDGDGGGMFMDAHYSIADLVIFFFGWHFPYLYTCTMEHSMAVYVGTDACVFVCVRAKEALRRRRGDRLSTMVAAAANGSEISTISTMDIYCVVVYAVCGAFV